MNTENEVFETAIEDQWFENGEYEPEKNSSAGATTSLVLGIISSIAWIIPIIGLPITVVGIVLGAINMKSKKHKGMAIAGFVVNIVFLAATLAKGILDIIKLFKKK